VVSRRLTCAEYGCCSNAFTNWQRTFDGATPRLSRPTLASGEHGAPVQGLGPCGEPNAFQSNG
jgi:hypothetical protein